MSRPPRPSTYGRMVEDLCQQLRRTVTTYGREWDRLSVPRMGEPVHVQTGQPADPTARASGAEQYRVVRLNERNAMLVGKTKLGEEDLAEAFRNLKHMMLVAEETLDVLDGDYPQKTRAARTPDAVTDRELQELLEHKRRRDAT